MKVFFATDLHASEVCFRKFCSAADFYGCDVLVMGGDVTGKLLIPIVVEDGHARYKLGGAEHRFSSNHVTSEVARIANMGYYAVVGGPEITDEFADPDRYEARLQQEAAARLRSWVEYAETKLAPKGITILAAPGNDDDPSIDHVLLDSTVFVNGEGVVTEILGLEVASSGWSNETPWHTPREATEEVLAERLRSIANNVRNPERAIFNFHVPPYGTPLDVCPQLDAHLGVVTVMGTPVMMHAGSAAVLKVIQEFKPMLSLHGHIHESRGATQLGRTLAVNPGSEYSEGVLLGAVIAIENGSVKYSFTAG